MPRGTETVLVLEDDQTVRDMAVRILKRLGYDVLVAADGEEALDLAGQRAGDVDLLMSDVVMPGMNGRELAERLQRRDPRLRVLYTSGYTENTIAHHGVLEQGLRFIGKPYTPQALARKLREILDG
jgi:CheY-like chemotaxis protein